jgi:hypothetical protein
MPARYVQSHDRIDERIELHSCAAGIICRNRRIIRADAVLHGFVY